MTESVKSSNVEHRALGAYEWLEARFPGTSLEVRMFIRVTELKNRSVVDPVTARKRGRVVDVLVDPTAGRLAGLTVAGEGDDAPTQIAAGRIARIGRAAVMLRRETDGEACDAHLHHENYLDYDSLVGLEVLDEGGDAVGGLKDARIDCDRLDISAYALVGTGWRGWLGRHSDIAPSLVTSWSRELMIVGRGDSS